MSNSINRNYKVQATIITPLSIGQGNEKDWMPGIDYVVRDNTLYHLDLEKMYHAGIDISRLTSIFVTGNARDVITLIDNRLQSVSDFQMEMPVSRTYNPIKTFLKNNLTGRPVLAGSSLKGAIRSALFNYFRDNEKSNKDVFGDMKAGTDFMRFIRVSDFDFTGTRLYNTVIYNLRSNGDEWQGGWKHALRNGTDGQFNPVGFNTVYECLVPGDVAEGKILMSKVLFSRMGINQPHYQIKQQLMNDESPNIALCDIIKDYTYNYLLKEYDFFEKYQNGANNTNLIMNSITKLTDIINDLEPDECVIKMSAGAGFHSITGDWQYNDYYDEPGIHNDPRNIRNFGKKKYKSRKIVQVGKKLSLMGFVKLKIQ